MRRNVAASGQRSPGFLASARSMAAHSAAGTSGRSSAIGRGASVTCFISIAVAELAWNGSTPVSSW
jgi:hypothetical protein